MKARYYIIAIAALIAGACSRNADLIEEDIQQITFTAYQEGYDAPTKTTVLDGGTQVYWEPSEEIKVFFKGSSGKFVSRNTEDATVTDFSGTINILTGANEGYSSSNTFWALYPYRPDAMSDGLSVTTVLPSEQTGRAGSFAKGTHLSVAQSGGLNLSFYNVCGGVRFSLTQAGIKSVTFEGNNGEALAGTIKIAFVEGAPVIQEITDPQSIITLTAPDGGTFQTGQWYYISAIPGALSNGFTLKFYKDNEWAKLTSTGPVTIKRSIFGSLAGADKDSVFKFLRPSVDLGLSVKWATNNVGASKPEEYGDYFSWGETEPKTIYNWLTYKWCNDDYDKQIKYCPSERFDFWDGTGSPDDLDKLEPEDDAAYVNWDETWRMPTIAEWEELIFNCTWTWTEDYCETGIAGYVVTSNVGGYTDKSIFLPAAGYRDEYYLFNDGSYGFYWSSSLGKETPCYAWYIQFDYAGEGWNDYYRFYGRSVRPVTQ